MTQVLRPISDPVIFVTGITVRTLSANRGTAL